uniref:Coiledcoil domaincontaining protein 19, mitochondriallike [Pseudopodoces humilis] n=1 Tax=Lepeophtheirus salmonis TaxID=72036 RepID=A0A0K2UBF1_LEPSM
MMRLKDDIEVGQTYGVERERVRLARQQNELDKEWRRKEMEDARNRAEQNREINRVREEQIKQRYEITARAAEGDKNYWNKAQVEMKEVLEHDKLNEEIKLKVNYFPLQFQTREIDFMNYRNDKTTLTISSGKWTRKKKKKGITCLELEKKKIMKPLRDKNTKREWKKLKKRNSSN